MVNVIVEMVGTSEAEAAAVATESGGLVATESGGAVATESGGVATTGDATAGDDTAANCGVMYAAEGPYTIDVRHIEAMVGTRSGGWRQSPAGTRRRRDRGRDRRFQGRDRRQDGGVGW